MKPSRDEIVEMIQRQAATAAPPVDPDFVERLERRLRSLDLTPVKAGPRRIGRFTVTAVVAGTLIAGAAAAAGVVTIRHATESPATTSATTAPPTTVDTVAAVTIPVVVPFTNPVATTTAVPVPITTAAAAPAAPEPATTPEPTTLPPPPVTTSPATTSTEVRVASTLTLICAATTTTINCSWDPGPDATTHYALLRTDPTSSNGRVFTPEPGATTYVDTLVGAGTTYTYLVHALDSSEHSVAHSDHVAVPCCA